MAVGTDGHGVQGALCELLFAVEGVLCVYFFSVFVGCLWQL